MSAGDERDGESGCFDPCFGHSAVNVRLMSRPAHDPKYAGAEKETAAGVAAAKTVMSVGTYTNGTIPDIAVVGQGAPQLVQLCVRKDDAFNRRICDEAEKTAPKRPALPLMPPLTAM